MSDTRGTRGGRTRAAVLRAASQRFATEGYAGTTGARIAADAGVSEATIAFHFGSKAGLLVAVMQAWYDDLLGRIDDLVVSEESPTDRMRRFLGWWLTHGAANHELLSVFAREGRQADHGEVVEAFRDCNRRVTRVVERLVEDLKHTGAVRPDVPTRVLRDAFFGTTEHLLSRRALTGRPADLDAAAGDVWDLLMHGASSGEAPAALPQRLASIEAKVDRLLERGTVPPMSYERAAAHLNDDHAEALVAIAQAYGSVPDAVAARVLALDDAGMDLDVEVADGATRHVRVPFNPPISEETVRDHLVELARQARYALGKN